MDGAGDDEEDIRDSGRVTIVSQVSSMGQKWRGAIKVRFSRGASTTRSPTMTTPA